MPASGGLHLAAWLADHELDDAAICRDARGAGVAVQPLASFHAGRPHAGLVLGDGALPRAAVDEGVRRLADTCGTPEGSRFKVFAPATTTSSSESADPSRRRR